MPLTQVKNTTNTEYETLHVAHYVIAILLLRLQRLI